MSDKTRRGVYKNLEISPYAFTSPYGDIFKFSSAKKLEIYTRDIEKELARLNKTIDKLCIRELLPTEIINLLTRQVYVSFYRRVEG